MKNYLKLIALSPLMISVAFAAGGPNNDNAMHGKGMQDSKMMSGGMMMNMMSHEQMMAMHDHMKQMRQTLQAIQKESDPQKRQALMQKHMDQIGTGMHMMNMGQDAGKGMMSMDSMMEMMNERMGMMNDNMGMMNMMMGQMREHKKHEMMKK